MADPDPIKLDDVVWEYIVPHLAAKETAETEAVNQQAIIDKILGAYFEGYRTGAWTFNIGKREFRFKEEEE